MPVLTIQTNLPKSKFTGEFLKKATLVLANTLDKPHKYCAVTVIPDLPMAFAGSTEPCGQASVLSIGHLGLKENPKHAKALHDLFENDLGISSSRIYIQFIDQKPEDVGYEKKTFYGVTIAD